MCNPRETLSDLIVLKINKLVKTILRLKTYIGVPLLRYCVLVNLEFGKEKWSPRKKLCALEG